ncbi:extracellular superoxide dismutase [Cu-Zn] isoform X1 [Drosophila eugracilis]|uniref:extracellular superoxide dismutase [Cu-Zn] isoform X1 n=1 Tax=Drosophila eugracilis TaxID=29029 RepID=UPI0007E76E8F|nr:extracellular superoxide dismutase [Cu-Zn] isoform X1 [Drosophila eugracilis]
MLQYLIVALALSATICSAAQTRNMPIQAIAYLIGPVQSDNSQVKGNVTFTQNDCGQNVHVRVQLEGLKEGKHGFHIHEKGDLTNGCTSMGAHYNPDKVDHGGPDHEVRHVGDLGNLEANSSGIIDITYTDPVITLTGKLAVIGRGVVVHELEDDLGLGNHTDSKKTGNAGGRIACGVIGINVPSVSAPAPSTPRPQPLYYVPHEEPQDHVVYPLQRYPYPYPYPYPHPYPYPYPFSHQLYL